MSTMKITVGNSLDYIGPSIRNINQSIFTGGGRFQVVGNLLNLCLGFLKIIIKYPIHE